MLLCTVSMNLSDYVPFGDIHCFNKTKCITFLLIVQSLLHHNPPVIWIKIIKIECLHGIKNRNLDNLQTSYACDSCMRNVLYEVGSKNLDATRVDTQYNFPS